MLAPSRASVDHHTMVCIRCNQLQLLSSVQLSSLTAKETYDLTVRTTLVPIYLVGEIYDVNASYDVTRRLTRLPIYLLSCQSVRSLEALLLLNWETCQMMLSENEQDQSLH